MEFEWHEAKRVKNLDRHNIDFRDAFLIFGGRHIVGDATTVDRERRRMATGTIDDLYVTVIHTMRGNTVRIISYGGLGMKRDNGISRYTAAELKALRDRGESKTDWVKVRSKTEAELELDIADDPDFRNVPDNWHDAAKAIMPVAKTLLSLRLDAEVVDWFKQQGPGYQTRMNAVLRAFVDHAGARKN